VSRIESIRKLLADAPDDTFLLYSLGMELLAAGRSAEAAEQFRRALEVDADYLAAYPQAAKALQACADPAGAAEMLRVGLVVAEKAGDTHARDRLKLQLDALGG